jgi:hypothetical protein
MENNPYNRTIANHVRKNLNKSLENDRRQHMFPHITDLRAGLSLHNPHLKQYDRGTNPIITNSKTEEIQTNKDAGNEIADRVKVDVSGDKISGLEGGACWCEKAEAIKNGNIDIHNIIKKLKLKKKNKDEIINNLKKINNKQKREGKGLGDIFKKIIEGISTVGRSGKHLGKSVVKSFVDPQNLKKEDVLNIYTMGTHSGAKKKGGELPAERVKRIRQEGGAKKKQTIKDKEDEKLGAEIKGLKDEELEGKGFIGDLANMIGLGKKKGKKGKKDKDEDKDKDKDKDKDIFKKGYGKLKGGAGDTGRNIGGSLVPPQDMKGSTLSGFGKEKKKGKTEWMKLIDEVKKKPEMKGKGVKEIINYIKKNNLYKKK